jgi:hypothetical protein
VPAPPVRRAGAHRRGASIAAAITIRRRPGRPATVPATAALALLAAVTGACSVPDAAPPASLPTTTASPGASSTATTAAPPATFPLRGTLVDDPGRAASPALVVKVGNDERARPPAGLGDADVIFEEKVEGPFSRFAAVFHSRLPDAVGPVRSGRSTDVAIVADLNRPLFAFSGANGHFLGLLRAAPLVDVGAEVRPDAYQRRGDRPAPYNLWAFPSRLVEPLPEGASPPGPRFTYRADPGPVPGAPAVGRLDYDFGGPGDRIAFTWDGDRHGWARTQNGTPHVDTGGEVLAPANVIVQLVGYTDTGERDVAGTPVPEATLIDTGPAWVFTGGALVKATWSRPDPARPVEYRALDGSPVSLVPGQTWVALVPAEGAGFTVAGPDGADLR